MKGRSEMHKKKPIAQREACLRDRKPWFKAKVSRAYVIVVVVARLVQRHIAGNMVHYP